MNARKPDAARPFTESQADSVLSGERTENPVLAELGPVLDVLRTAALATPEPVKVDAMAALLGAAAAEATPTDATAHQHSAASQRSSAMKTRTRIVSAVGAAIALALGTAGVAAASEDALPGDPLYVVKRTLEDIGVYEGGLDERADEAVQLAEQGDEEEALDHLADSLEEEGDEESAETLRNAAQAVLSGGSEQSLATRTAVSEMLQWMADTDLTGREFGQGVAERARAINHPVADEPVEGEPVEGEPTEDVPATDDGKGKPEGVGKPDGAGKPDSAGNPDTGGKPEGSGKPDSAGKPENPGRPAKG